MHMANKTIKDIPTPIIKLIFGTFRLLLRVISTHLPASFTILEFVHDKQNDSFRHYLQ
jgi:hypothetical protein